MRGPVTDGACRHALHIALLLLVLGPGRSLAARGGAAPEIPRNRILVIGKVTSNPRKHYRYLKPIVAYVAERLSDEGIEEGRVLMARDNETMVRHLSDGRVDWVTETLFSAVQIARDSGAEIILKRWKKDAPEYHTVFISRQDSGIDSLSQLTDRTIALEDPGSTTAFLLPASILFEHGGALARLRTAGERPPPGTTGYVFAGQEINIAAWVYEGRVDAGAINDYDWGRPDHTPPVFRKDLRVFHHSERVVRCVELVRDGLDTELKARLREVLLNAHADPKARSALRAYQRTRRFEAIDAEAAREIDEAGRTMERLLPKLEPGR